MNISAYLFGIFDHRYTQYPADGNDSFFEYCIKLSRNDEQMIVRRRERLMYYTFVKFLDKKHESCIGLSLSFGDLAATSYKHLYQLFGDGIESLAMEGEILSYDNDDITPNCMALNDKGVEIRTLEKYLRSKMDYIDLDLKPLPPVSYANSRNSVKYTSLGKNKESIQSYINTYGFTIISSNIDEGSEFESELEKILYPNGRKKGHGKNTNFITNYIKKLLCK